MDNIKISHKQRSHIKIFSFLSEITAKIFFNGEILPKTCKVHLCACVCEHTCAGVFMCICVCVWGFSGIETFKKHSVHKF